MKDEQPIYFTIKIGQITANHFPELRNQIREWEHCKVLLFPSKEGMRNYCRNTLMVDDVDDIDGLFCPYVRETYDSEGNCVGTSPDIGTITMHCQRLTFEVIVHELAHAAREYVDHIQVIDEQRHELIPTLIGLMTAQTIKQIQATGYCVTAD